MHTERRPDPLSLGDPVLHGTDRSCNRLGLKGPVFQENSDPFALIQHKRSKVSFFAKQIRTTVQRRFGLAPLTKRDAVGSSQRIVYYYRRNSGLRIRICKTAMRKIRTLRAYNFTVELLDCPTMMQW